MTGEEDLEHCFYVIRKCGSVKADPICVVLGLIKWMQTLVKLLLCAVAIRLVMNIMVSHSILTYICLNVLII